jgi:ribosomal protein L32
MITIPLSKLQSAATLKAPGYYDACLAAGTLVGNNLQLTESAFAALRAQFSPPPLSTQIQSAAGAVVAECGAALSGEAAVDDATKAARLTTCEACEFFIAADRRCQKCGCWMELKTSFRTATCPENKWAR